MPKFVLSCDIVLPVVLDVEATDEDAALDKLHEMDPAVLLKLASKESSGITILEGSDHVEDIIS